MRFPMRAARYLRSVRLTSRCDIERIGAIGHIPAELASDRRSGRLSSWTRYWRCVRFAMEASFRSLLCPLSAAALFQSLYLTVASVFPWAS